VDAYRSAHADLRRARSRLEALDGESREREREKDLLAYQVQEIEAAALRVGELDALLADEPRLANAERLRELADAAERALGDDRAAADALADAAGRLTAAAALDPSAKALAARADALLVDARDLAAEVRAYRDAAWADPGRLATVQARIHLIKGLERKYGEGDAGILAYLDAVRSRLDGLDGRAEEREELVAAIGGLVSLASGLAARVSSGRRSAAGPLASAISEELQQLGMPGARFEVHVDPLAEAGPDGAEGVEFRFAGGPRQALLAFSKVASGGELSRTMLACRSVLADLDDVPTLVFDEIDAGIGGRAAAAVGQRLAGLAQSRQVLVVTHLAQIAAHADRHFRVTKEDGSTHIRSLSGDARSAELARMLSGDISDVSLAHARELMAVGSARRLRAPDGPGPT
jgi:DNA repair protein RecN (Recombination protein N)